MSILALLVVFKGWVGGSTGSKPNPEPRGMNALTLPIGVAHFTAEMIIIDCRRGRQFSKRKSGALASDVRG